MVGKRAYPTEVDNEGVPMKTEEFETINSHALTYIMINALKELDARLKALEV